MFKFLWRLFFWWPDAKPEPAPEQPETIGGSVFTGRDSERDRLFGAWDSALVDLQSKLPRLRPRAPVGDVAHGEAMDGLDDLPPIVCEGDSVVDEQPMAMSLASTPAPNITDTVIGFFLRQTFIGHQLSALLAQNWLIKKACWMPAQDAVRKGFTINTPEGDDGGTVKLLERYDKRMNLRDNLTQFVGFGRVFGIRIAIYKFEFDNKEFERDFYANPFNPEAITPRSYKGIVQVDPYWCVPELDASAVNDPTSMHFYEPTWWQINGVRYHRSHLAIYREGDVPDILKPSYLYGGYPLPQLIVERVYAAERTANEAPSLAMCKRLITLQTNSEEMLAGGPEALRRLAVWSELMNNYGVKVVGEEEQVAAHDTSLADFDATVMTQYQLVASIAECPATKLLGTSPKGFGASGDYEIESYHETLESIQAGAMTRLVDGHHLRLMHSEVIPRLGTNPDWTVPEIEVVWAPLDTPTRKEVAEINQLNANTDSLLVAAGAVDGVDVRERVIRDKHSGYSGIPGAYRPGEEPEDGEVPATSLQPPVTLG